MPYGTYLPYRTLDRFKPTFSRVYGAVDPAREKLRKLVRGKQANAAKFPIRQIDFKTPEEFVKHIDKRLI